jgi:signal transduction histidine kinase/CheY-like chemotaxis protein
VAAVVPVARNGQQVGAIYVERSLGDLPAHIALVTLVGCGALSVAALVALFAARQLQRVVSRPIVELAAAARRVGHEDLTELPPVVAPPDETGALVQAFNDMVGRLVTTNAALRAEIEERKKLHQEREQILAREREASRLKDEFLAAVSHELRTPLNAILGWTQVLTQTSPTPEKAAHALASLSRNAHTQKRLIEDLLDVSRIMVGKLQLTPSLVDLRTIVEAALEVTAPAAAVKGITLAYSADVDGCPVRGDAHRLQQILWNVLSNAVKFTPPGGRVAVRLTRADAVARIAVSDDGAGIAREVLPYIFERFRQGDGSITREYGGLGLGLAIAKELIELHGGTITASSQGPGHGAVFTLTFPLAPASADGAPAFAAVPPSDALAGLDLVVIDDNADALNIAAAILSAAGASVRQASSGQEGVDQVRANIPSAVLCDIGMPSMDGFAVLDAVRRVSPDGKPVPVIAVTAYASEEYRARCLSAGFEGFVAKPYLATEVVGQVAMVVQRHAAAADSLQ